MCYRSYYFFQTRRNMIFLFQFYFIICDGKFAIMDLISYSRRKNKYTSITVLFLNASYYMFSRDSSFSLSLLE